jgi:hypothetical protein
MLRLSALTAKSLRAPPGKHDEPGLDLIVDRLWARDSLNGILPVCRALHLADGEALEVIGAWIGLSFFETEYTRRELEMFTLVQWLIDCETKELPAQFELRNEHLLRLAVVRSRLKALWRESNEFHARYNASLACLADPEAGIEPCLEVLQTARRDFWRCGELMLLLDQCVSIHAMHQQLKRRDEQDKSRTAPVDAGQTDFDSMRATVSLQHEILSAYRAA